MSFTSARSFSSSGFRSSGSFKSPTIKTGGFKTSTFSSKVSTTTPKIGVKSSPNSLTTSQKAVNVLKETVKTPLINHGYPAGAKSYIHSNSLIPTYRLIQTSTLKPIIPPITHKSSFRGNLLTISALIFAVIFACFVIYKIKKERDAYYKD